MATASHPSGPNFVSYYAIDANASGDDGEADGVVKHLLIGPFSGFHEDDSLLY